MPWGLVIRLLTRVLAGMLIWRTASARRGAGAAPLDAAQRRTRIDATVAVQAVLEGAAISWRITGLAAFGAAAAVLLTAGVTLTVLSPRWLGIVLLALATVAAMAALLELRRLWQLVSARRRRRDQQALRSQVS